MASNVWTRLLRHQKAEYEKQIAEMEERHYIELFEMQKKVDWATLHLQDAEVKLRIKDSEIARKEEMISALQKQLRREAQFRRSIETEENVNETVTDSNSECSGSEHGSH